MLRKKTLFVFVGDGLPGSVIYCNSRLAISGQWDEWQTVTHPTRGRPGDKSKALQAKTRAGENPAPHITNRWGAMKTREFRLYMESVSLVLKLEDANAPRRTIDRAWDRVFRRMYICNHVKPQPAEQINAGEIND